MRGIVLLPLLLLLLLLAACDPASLRLPSVFKQPMGLSVKQQDAETAAVHPTGGKNSVHCRVSGGSGKIGGRLQPLAPADFMLTEEGSRTVHLYPRKGNGAVALEGWANRDRQQLVFCPAPEAGAAPTQKLSCAAFYVLDDDLAAGIKRTFDVPRTIEGASLTCANSPDRLKP
jgi:hypothetical protein